MLSSGRRELCTLSSAQPLISMYIYSDGANNFGLKSGVPIQKENDAPLRPETKGEEISHSSKLKKAKAKAQVLGIAPLNMRSMCQRRFTIIEVVTDQHWL